MAPTRRAVAALLRAATFADGRCTGLLQRLPYSTGPKLPGAAEGAVRNAPLPGIPGSAPTATATSGAATADAAGRTVAATGPTPAAATPSSVAAAPPKSVAAAAPAAPAPPPAATAPGAAAQTPAIPTPPPPAPSPTATAAPATGAGGAAGGAAAADPLRGERRGVRDPYLLIPVFGIPLLAAWLGYEMYKWKRHEENMFGMTEAIKRTLGPAAHKQGQPATPQLPTGLPRKPPSLDTPDSSTAAAGPIAAPGQSEVKTTPASASAHDTAAASQTHAAAAPAAPEVAAAGGAGAVGPAPAAEPAAAPSSADSSSTAPAAAPADAHTQASTAPAAASLHAAEKAREEPPAAATRDAGQHAEEPQQELRHASTATAAAPAAPATAALASTTAAEDTTEASSAAMAGPRTPVLQRVDEAEVAPLRKSEMGVDLDLSPSGLIQFAIERGRGAGQDWAAYAHHLNQAMADAELMGRAAQQIKAWHEETLHKLQAAHQEEVARLKSEAEQAAQQAEKIREAAKANVETFKRLLKQHQEMAAELRDLEVSQAEKRVGLRATQQMAAERTERLGALDEVRLQLAALAAAHDARADQQTTSNIVHTLSMSVHALDAALSRGMPLTPLLSQLVERAAQVHAARPPAAAAAAATVTAAAGTPSETADGAAEGSPAAEPAAAAVPQVPSDVALILAAAHSIPAPAARKGIPTLEQLEFRLRGMKQTVSALALLPAPSDNHSSGGILAHAVARIIAWFKVDQSHAVRALGPDAAMSGDGGGVDAALAVAELYLSQGRLHEAAHVLKQAAQGSAAAAAVDAWCTDALARASADQALKVLRAHATVMAASVV